MNLIFFSGYNDRADYYTSQLIAAAEDAHISYYTVDYNNLSTFTSSVLTDYIASGDCAAVIFDDIGLMLNDENNSNFWASHQIPVYSFLLSYPIGSPSYLLSPPAELHLLIPDQSWESNMQKRFPCIKNYLFLPCGGTFEPVDNTCSALVSYADRSIDVLCIEDCEQIHDENSPSYTFLKNNGQDLIQYCIAQQIAEANRSTESIIQAYFHAENETCTLEQMEQVLHELTPIVSQTARRYLQQETIRQLDQAGLAVEVYGSFWESPDYIYSDHIHLHPSISRKDANRLTGQSKISIHFMPDYLQGADARFFEILANGAVCIATTNEYTKRRFKDGTHMVNFDKTNPNQLVADIRYLLTHESVAEKIANKGCAQATRDTWRQRLNRLMELI